jgi:hypothetical protein
LDLAMPLQNRVTPFGELIAVPARGTMFGNRGGRFHRDDQTLGVRRSVSRRWICCVLDFKGRQRDVWSRGYTELFFLDEVTALAAGHRPCFECRRRDANSFAECWAKANRMNGAPSADEMDEVIHHERIDGRAKRRRRMALDTLPDGAMIALPGVRGDDAYAVRGATLLRWTPSGYRGAIRRPSNGSADMLTPPSIVKVLKAGFEPRWHASAARRR